MISIIDPYVKEDWIGIIQLTHFATERFKEEPYGLWDIDKSKPTKDIVSSSIENGRTFIVCENEEAIGIVFFYDRIEDSCSGGLWIPPLMRNKGKAMQVLKSAFEYAIQLGIRYLYGWIAKDNFKSIRLAEKLGAENIAESLQQCNGEEQIIISYKYDLEKFKSIFPAGKMDDVQ